MKNRKIGSGAKYRRKVRHNPFIPWTQESEYWFGFITADGNLSKNMSTISITTKDIIHLEKYNRWLGGNLNPYVRENKIATFYFSHQYIGQWINFQGVTPNKSKTLRLQKDFTWHILRGVFDGDGTCRVRKNSEEIKITSGSKIFLHQIKAFLAKYNIISSIRIQHKNTYCINIAANSMLKFILYLYQDSTVHLERKADIMRLIVERRLSKSGEFRENPSITWTTLSQAAKDLGFAEGATTRSLSSNNNKIHERPTSY